MPTLYVVGTPIGNLGDMTPRAVEVLRSVALIAAEDTRVTRKLTNHFGIDTPLTSCHQHNEADKGEALADAARRCAPCPSAAWIPGNSPFTDSFPGKRKPCGKSCWPWL